MKRDENLTDAQKNARAKVRAKARAWMRNNPLRGPMRRALFELLAELLEEDGSFYPGARWLAWRLGTNTMTVTKYMTEFADRGLIVLLDRKGRGGSNRYRLDYERSRELYPDTVTREQFEALNYPSRFRGEVSNKAEHFEDPEVCNEVEHFEEENATGYAPKCATSEAEVFNFSARSVQHGLTKGFKENTAGASASADSRTLIAAGPSRLAATLRAPAERENAARKTGDIEATARALVDLFVERCGPAQRDEAEAGCVAFAEQGLTADDMNYAIDRADKPRWTYVRKRLEAIVETNRTVVADGMTDAQTVARARRLEAVFARHIAKPERFIGRKALADMLVRVTRKGVHEDLFEAACVAVVWNGKPKTWKSVERELDAMKKARESEGHQRDEGDTAFFDRPATTAGSATDAARAATYAIERAQRSARAATRDTKGTT